MSEADAPADALVIFTPSGRRGRFPRGTPLLDAARALGVYVESVCGGRGLCGRCQATPTFGRFEKHGLTSAPAHLSPAGEGEARYARLRALPADRRLTCQARIAGDLVVDIPADAAINPQIVRKRAEARDIAVDPAIRLVTLAVPAPTLEQPLGAVDRLRLELARAGFEIADVELGVVAGVGAALAAGEGTVTAALYDESGRTTLTGVWPGERKIALGLAVDIGSTTIAAHLVDLVSGRTLASCGASNPQIRFGEDLMSRVIASRPSGCSIT